MQLWLVNPQVVTRLSSLKGPSCGMDKGKRLTRCSKVVQMMAALVAAAACDQASWVVPKPLGQAGTACVPTVGTEPST
jgi:hypothetical protein